LAKNSSGDFIILRALFQSVPLGFLFLSTSIASGKKPANKYIVALKTSGTPGGGLAQDLAYWKSVFLILFRAALADSTSGIAASRSAYVEDFLNSTSFLITAHLSASRLALAFSISTFPFSTPTTYANASASYLLPSASIYFSLTCISISATCSAVSLSLINP